MENKSDKRLMILEASERSGEVSKSPWNGPSQRSAAAPRPGSSSQGNPSPIFSPL